MSYVGIALGDIPSSQLTPWSWRAGGPFLKISQRQLAEFIEGTFTAWEGRTGDGQPQPFDSEAFYDDLLQWFLTAVGQDCMEEVTSVVMSQVAHEHMEAHRLKGSGLPPHGLSVLAALMVLFDQTKGSKKFDPMVRIFRDGAIEPLDTSNLLPKPVTITFGYIPCRSSMSLEEGRAIGQVIAIPDDRTEDFLNICDGVARSTSVHGAFDPDKYYHNLREFVLRLIGETQMPYVHSIVLVPKVLDRLKEIRVTSDGLPPEGLSMLSSLVTLLRQADDGREDGHYIEVLVYRDGSLTTVDLSYEA